ncbi:hypothetical protein [Pyrococcus sp. ST04]|uniref:hypothetical protein n=1 Tax=Pyrococcus sp. ST04 TaxID=1183377 RepID=UPI00026058CE|nr:hypothetical protein [Pyrococcus sp. ST04]AFK22222.1 hypothetical protein Py04_0620 [Pyrococcus sp. ST04]
MKKACPLLVLLVLMMPFAMAQTGEFEVSGKIIGLTNATTSGEISLVNTLPVKFSYVTIKDLKFFDESGEEVNGFKIEFQESIIKSWSPGEKKVLMYTLSSGNVTPGLYTLYLFMWGFTEDNKLYLLRAYVPVEVMDRPIIFKEAISLIKDRPHSKIALTGDSIVVYSHVVNIANEKIKLQAKAELIDPTGETVVSRQETVFLNPGDNLVRFELQIPDPAPQGRYEVKYTLTYDRGTYEYSESYWVELGIGLADLSVEKTNALQGEKNKAYLIVSSERDTILNVSWKVYDVKGALLSENETEVSVVPGSNIIGIPLPTAYPGTNKFIVKVFYKGVLIGEKSGEYLVVGYPSLLARAENSTLHITVLNPNSFQLQGLLIYRISWENGNLVKETRELKIPPGNMSLKINLKGEGRYSYDIVLQILNREFRVSGEGFVQPKPSSPTLTQEKTTTTLTTSKTEEQHWTTTSTFSPTTTTFKAGTLGTKWLVIVAILAVVVLAGVSVYYALERSPKRRRRARKKPKRKSPLGRVK